MSTEIPASHLDLAKNSSVAILTTNGLDGRPQTSALWFLYDEDGTIGISLNGARQKTKNLLRDPKVTLFIVDSANPYKTLEIRGDATATPDVGYVFADKVGKKYGGTDLRAMDQPGETRYKVTIEPVKINVFGQ